MLSRACTDRCKRPSSNPIVDKEAAKASPRIKGLSPLCPPGSSYLYLLYPALVVLAFLMSLSGAPWNFIWGHPNYFYLSLFLLAFLVALLCAPWNVPGILPPLVLLAFLITLPCAPWNSTLAP